MSLRLYDAHNHLHDERLAPFAEAIRRDLEAEPIVAMVVNGSCEEDWPAVAALARKDPRVIPSFGYHPWYIKERSQAWQQTLVAQLDSMPSAIGEIGLDKWVKDHDLADQQAVFTWQLRLAAERNLPVSIHCLQAWGKLLELLAGSPRPHCGFVLHSFGGPREMIDHLAELGAYFSLPGYYAWDRKERQRESFLHVPPDRLLIETDAPDQTLPPARTRYHLAESPPCKPLNHPANLRAVYEFASELLGWPLDDLAALVETNFRRLFGGVVPQVPRPAAPP